jgi:surfactin synthase thioesterase subunit
VPLVLVWPDAGQAECDVRAVLGGVPAELVIGSWDPGADDRGRADLLTSVRMARDLISARDRDPDGLALVGFGLGGVAAAGLTRYAKRLGIDLGLVVAVAGRWDEPDPFSGAPLGGLPERVELVDRADDVSAMLITRWRPR